MSSGAGCRKPRSGVSAVDIWDDAGIFDDPLEPPEYVAESLRAWCEYDRKRRDARNELRVTEREDLYLRAPDYDPLSDWLDEPLPLEGL